jgi:hypothetical protein
MVVSAVWAVVGLYARQARQAGRFGLAAFLIAFAGLSLSFGGNWAYAFAAPELAKAAPGVLDNPTAFSSVLSAGLMVSYLLGVAGWLLMGVATLTARVLPRWPAVTMIVSIILVGVMLPLFGSLSPAVKILFNVLISAGPAALGYAVWMEKDTTGGQ